jgi:hypothetical protein
MDHKYSYSYLFPAESALLAVDCQKGDVIFLRLIRRLSYPIYLFYHF